MEQLTAADVLGIDVQEGRVLIGDRRIVCAFETDSVTMTPALWARIQAKHNEVGRMLTEEELRAVLRADSGDDRDA